MSAGKASGCRLTGSLSEGRAGKAPRLGIRRNEDSLERSTSAIRHHRRATGLKRRYGGGLRGISGILREGVRNPSLARGRDASEGEVDKNTGDHAGSQRGDEPGGHLGGDD